MNDTIENYSTNKRTIFDSIIHNDINKSFQAVMKRRKTIRNEYEFKNNF